MSLVRIEDRDLSVTSLRPLGDQILVKVVNRNKHGQIILPETLKHKGEAVIGNVLRVGPGASAVETGELIPMRVNRGQCIVFMAYGGDPFSVGGVGDEYQFVREQQVWATCEVDADGGMTKLQPVGDHVLLEMEDDHVLKSGLVLNEQALAKYRRAKVLGVGEGLRFMATGKTDPMQVKVGSRVLFARYSGAEVTVKGVKLRLAQDVDCEVEWHE